MTRALRLLVVDGNTRAVNAANVEAGGSVTGERYAQVLAGLRPGARITTIAPADGPVDVRRLHAEYAFDGAVFTGSALNVYDATDEVRRQVDVMTALLALRVPVFGSCWGLQVAAVALGGKVRRNPKGRELGFARNIARTPAGRSHPLLAGKPDGYAAICVHLDEIEVLPDGMTVLATNAVSDVQAAAWRSSDGRSWFWGVQYHPEYDFGQITAVIVRYGPERLISEGFFRGRSDYDAYLADLRTLQSRPDATSEGWRHGLDASVTQRSLRERELSNWLDAIGDARG